MDKNLLLFNYFPLYQSLFKFYCTKDYDTLKNSITNKIIKKIEEYYSNQNINILEGIYNIEKNINKILTLKDFDNCQKYFSVKYFVFYKITNSNLLQLQKEFPNIEIKDIDINKFIIKYSFPFIEKVINEFKNKEYEYIINNGFYDIQNEITKSQLYEFLVINKLRYNLRIRLFQGLFESITKVIEIFSPFDILNKKISNSIYLKSIEEFKETNNDDVILFIFKFSKVPRYDAMIFVKKKML